MHFYRFGALTVVLTAVLTHHTALANQDPPVPANSSSSLAGCSSSTDAGDGTGCSLTLSHEPLPPAPVDEDPRDRCGLEIAWQNTSAGARCFVNCGNRVTDPSHGANYQPFPDDEGSCEPGGPRRRRRTCGPPPAGTEAYHHSSVDGNCPVECGAAVINPNNATRYIPYPWHTSPSGFAPCYRPCGHPQRAWQNDVPPPAGDCYAGCGEAVNDTYRSDPSYVPFAWQTTSSAQRCYRCGRTGSQWQNSNANASCYAACDEAVNDEVNQNHVPFPSQNTDPTATCYVSPDCGSPGNPWTYSAVPNLVRCEVDCDRTVTDAYVGAHRPFPHQDTDPGAACYCGTADGPPWQTTDPEALCYQPPPECPWQDFTWSEDNNVCGPGRAASGPAGTSHTFTDTTLPTTGSMTATCELQPDETVQWVESDISCESPTVTCAAQTFTWSEPYGTHECGPELAQSGDAQIAIAGNLYGVLLIDDDPPTTGSLLVRCYTHSSLNGAPLPEPFWSTVFGNPACDTHDDQLCASRAMTWEQNGVQCGPEPSGALQIGESASVGDVLGNSWGQLTVECVNDPDDGPTLVAGDSTCTARCPYGFHFWTVDGYTCQAATTWGASDGDVRAVEDDIAPVTGQGNIDLRRPNLGLQQRNMLGT